MTSHWTPVSALAKAVHTAGFLYDPGQDIIYSRMDALQRRLGYAYGYDAAALVISADLDCEPIFFDYDGKHWMIELWKGQYGLMSGCEIGVYTRPIGSAGPLYTLLDKTVGKRPNDSVPTHNLFYDCAADADMLTLKSTLHRDNQVLFTRGPEPHWWLTGFKWGVLSESSQLSADVEITLKDTAMLQAFQAAIADRQYPNLKVNGTTVSFTFAQPTAALQPPKPASILAQVHQTNQDVVSAYNKLALPTNDPNEVGAGFLNVAGLGLLHLADLFGLTVCQLAIGIGQSMSSVVTTLVAGKFADVAATVQSWLSAVSLALATWVGDIEKQLGIPLDFACYVEVDNTWGMSDLSLVASTHEDGSYAVAPPSWIARGTVARFGLQDPKPTGFGSAGTATYEYCDEDLTLKTVTFSYQCPTAHENSATSSQADWVCFGKSGDAGAPWSQPVPASRHPLFVRARRSPSSCRTALGKYAEYRASGPAERRFAATTWGRHMSVLSLLYRWALEEGHAQAEPFTLWMPKTLSPYATWEYSWMRPPSRARRRTRTFAPKIGGFGRPAGGLCCSARWGRWVL